MSETLIEHTLMQLIKLYMNSSRHTTNNITLKLYRVYDRVLLLSRHKEIKSNVEIVNPN